ncbi:MAG: PEP-CTERM sorting domain-containing protein [Coleofasciculus sp. G3-WIS-01]|uniref:PEP-CTERM sorting domain-containing protein n=1 Tax=Coleofasciculus sp. G3-WIS-01 TaxID=3069528 RepID=UPI0032F1D18B
MKRHLVATVVAGALAFGVGEAQAATITIDSFEDGEQDVSAIRGTVLDSVTGSTNEIVGGERDVQLTILNNRFNNRLNAEVEVLPPPPSGILAISNDAGVTSDTLITWDGVDENGLNLDVTGGGMNKFFRLDILSVDLGAELTLSLDGTATLTKSLSQTFDPISVIFKFSEFENAGAVDFSNVQSISLDITGPENFDLIADSFVATVPEPLTILGSGLALGFGGLLKKEYDKKQKKS